MKIAQIAPVIERVPAKKYGGTERVVHALTENLIKMGHEVTLFASGDSITSARLISVMDKPLRETKGKDVYGMDIGTMLNIGLAYKMAEKQGFDIIHDHNGYLSLPAANICRVPSVFTYHGPFREDVRRMFGILDKPYVATISKLQRRKAPELNHIGTVYNGLEMENYPFSAKEGDYLLYVGRIHEEKGTHLAIEIAKRTKLPLILAAKLDDIDFIQKYYEEKVKPHLGGNIKWIGEVDEGERNELMKNAKALLHPITWDEPFGLTLIEAMACGCPVVAIGRGSIPEVVKHGKTGYVARNVEEMIDCIPKLEKINRYDCRKHALANFSAQRMAKGYENVYRQIISMETSRERVYERMGENKWRLKSKMRSLKTEWEKS